MRGFFIDLYSSREKTQEEQKIYLDLTSPDEPMHPRPKILIHENNSTRERQA
jgi:hypothetical protein